MSTFSNLFYNYLSQQVTIYAASFILIVGLSGGLLNLIVFLSLRTFRQNSCTFYLIIMSFANIVHLITALTAYIMSVGFEIDWTTNSIYFCRSRLFMFQLWLLTSLTCMCLATIDQFLSTSFNPRWHRWSNIKLARYIVIGVFVFWLLHGIPFALYQDIIVSPYDTNKSICTTTNVIMQQYFNFGFVLVFMGILPLTVMTVFGLLAYYNVQHLAYRTVPLVRRELDKQLTHMVFMQVFYNFLVLSPFVITTCITFYSPTNDLSKFLRILSINFHNFYFASPFYIYVCVSKRFRQQFKHVFCIIHLNRCQRNTLNQNQVLPIPLKVSINMLDAQ